jgi:hypothetical protein
MNFLKKLFTFKWGWETQDPIEVYLSNSVDLVDLEQRQKAITYGNINPNLRGWSLCVKDLYRGLKILVVIERQLN